MLIAQEAGFQEAILTDGLPFQCQSLQLLGVKQQQILTTKEPITSREFWVSEAYCGSRIADSRPLLTKSLTSRLNRFASNPKRRLFIDRTGAGNHRDIINKADVLKVVQSFGFEVFHPSQHSFEEQLRVYGQTKVLCGAHGAGMTNTLFMPPGGLHIEFFTSAYKNDTNRGLAQISGHEYVELVHPTPPGHPKNSDSPFVDIKRLQQVLSDRL